MPTTDRPPITQQLSPTLKGKSLASDPAHVDWRNRMRPAEPGKRPETRQLWARDTRLPDGSPLVEISDGHAPEFRADCRAGHLICPVPGCQDPRYVARGGSKRHHFAHRRAPTDSLHTPERWFHVVAKNHIGEWLKHHLPGAQVTVDNLALDNGQVPDVVALLPDSRRFAFEIQYSAITYEEWLRRHRGYHSQGVIDVWLFGHIPPHLRAAPGQHDVPLFILPPLQESLFRHDYPVRWIDPDTRTIHVLDRTSVRWSRSYARRYAALISDPLTECRIEGPHFVTPRDRAITLDLARRRAARAQAAVQEAKRQAQQQEYDRKRAEALAKLRERNDAEWQTIKDKIIARFGALPPIIEQPTDGDDGITAYSPAHWRARTFLELVQDKVGTDFTWGRAVAPFIRSQPHKADEARAAMDAFLLRLNAAGYVSFNAHGPRFGPFIHVSADITTDPATTPELPWNPTHAARVEAAIRTACARAQLPYTVRRFHGTLLFQMRNHPGKEIALFVALDSPPSWDDLFAALCSNNSGGDPFEFWFSPHAQADQLRKGLPCFPVQFLDGRAPIVKLMHSNRYLHEIVLDLLAHPFNWLDIASGR